MNPKPEQPRLPPLAARDPKDELAGPDSLLPAPCLWLLNGGLHPRHFEIHRGAEHRLGSPDHNQLVQW